MKTISIASRLGVAVAALAGVLALSQPIPAEAAHGGGGGGGHGGGFGGGFHGGGFGGGFHGGGISGGGFHANAMGAGGFQGAQFGGHDGFGHRGGFDGWSGGGLGWGATDYDYGNDYGSPDYGAYPSDGYSQPYASQYWYYCQNPSGYYPYVQQCTTNWQPVPAG